MYLENGRLRKYASGLLFVKILGMTAKLARLEELIGHKFGDLDLLERSLTHRSWAYETLAGESEDVIREKHNETMEFVGDSVLGLIIADTFSTRTGRLRKATDLMNTAS